jgi:hypothetical protein
MGLMDGPRVVGTNAEVEATLTDAVGRVVTLASVLLHRFAHIHGGA